MCKEFVPAKRFSHPGGPAVGGCSGKWEWEVGCGSGMGVGVEVGGNGSGIGSGSVGRSLREAPAAIPGWE